MNRRRFLGTSLAAAGALLVKADEPPRDKLTICVPLTHSDWMLKPGMVWGEAGVRHMLDACKASGWSHVLWRTTDAGQATYASKVMRPGIKSAADTIFSPATDEGRAAVKHLLPNLTEAQSKKVLQQFLGMDYGSFDSLAAAVKYGHQIGLQIHAWVTINEDDHGWGWQTEFSKAHPEFRWVRRDGKTYHSQISYAFPEVRAYKLSILKELLDGYAIDGLFIDWIRTGDIRDNPQNDPNGIADYGYETPSLERYKLLHGKDPREVPVDDEAWARVRAEGSSQFMRDARKLIASYNRAVPLCAMVGHPWHYRGTIDRIAGNLKGLLINVKTWAKEGLVDSVIAAGYYRDGGTPEKAWQALHEETAGNVDVWTYGWVPQTVADAERDFNLAEKLGAKTVLFWEADYIDDRPNAAELQKAMRNRAKM